jgi:ribosome recycling factor
MSRITIDEFESKAQSTVEFLREDLRKIRSGRAHPSLVEAIFVDAYGSSQPLKNLANINVGDANLLTIQPWDKSLADSIVKSIQEANLGINPSVNGDQIRLVLPSLTEERRGEYVKLMKDELEKARVAIRAIRKDVIVGLDKSKKDGDIPEDHYDRMIKELQEKVDVANKKIDELGEQKEKDLTTV